MAGHWCDTTWLQRKYSIRLRGGFLLECSGGTASRVNNLLNISTTCLKTPGSFLTFWTETGLVDELRLCFKDDLFLSRECGIVPQSYGNMTVVNPQVSKQYISNLHDVFLQHKKEDTYCLWEVHDLNLSTVILHFMSHIYSVAPNALKWRYILFSLLGWNFCLEFAAFRT